jgi:hypothetical protein
MRRAKMRNIGFALLLGSTLLACTTEDANPTQLGDDELGGEAGDGEMAKADGIDTFGIYAAAKVGALECNGAGTCTRVQLTRANRSTTTCADGAVKSVCEVRTLDFSKLKLSATKLHDVMGKLQASAETPEIGAQLLVRGKYVHGKNPTQPGVDWVTFQVTELWTARMPEGRVEGTFVMLSDRGLRCIAAPCPSLAETRINSSRTANIEGIDWKLPWGEAPSFEDDVYEAETHPDGLIVTGFRSHGHENGLPSTYRTAEQVYLRVQ